MARNPLPAADKILFSSVVLGYLNSTLYEYLQGVQEALSLHNILLFYIHSRPIRVCTVKCVVLNGIIFLGSIFFFDHVVIPVIHLFGELVHGSSTNEGSEVEWFRQLIDGLVSLLYQVLWMYPIYCISFILNTIWYQEIADSAWKTMYHFSLYYDPVTSAEWRSIFLASCFILTPVLYGRDELYRAFVVTSLVVQIFLFYMIPLIGPLFSFVYLSWLYSLYCFEYKWSLHGWNLEKRLNYLEQHWAFFAGFGSPFTLATFFAPNFVSKGIFALLFPVFLLLSIACEPSVCTVRGKMPIFRLAKWTSLQVLRGLGKRTGIKKQRERGSSK